MKTGMAILYCSLFLGFLCPGVLGETIPLDQAIREGKVEAEITGMGGSTGDTVQITVRRTVPGLLRLTLAPGTVFKSKSGNIQNMLAASVKGERLGEKKYQPTTEMLLADNEKHTYVVEAYCLDFHKGNPGRSDSFSLAPPDERATKVLQAGKNKSASIQAIQAALWVDRENVSAGELKGRFPVNDADIKMARRLLQDVRNTEAATKEPQVKVKGDEQVVLKVGDTVTVPKDGTKLMLGSKVLAVLPKGATFEIVKVRGEWTGGHAVLNGDRQTGWVRKSEFDLALARRRTQDGVEAGKRASQVLNAFGACKVTQVNFGGIDKAEAAQRELSRCESEKALLVRQTVPRLAAVHEGTYLAFLLECEPGPRLKQLVREFGPPEIELEGKAVFSGRFAPITTELKWHRYGWLEVGVIDGELTRIIRVDCPAYGKASAAIQQR